MLLVHLLPRGSDQIRLEEGFSHGRVSSPSLLPPPLHKRHIHKDFTLANARRTRAASFSPRLRPSITSSAAQKSSLAATSDVSCSADAAAAAAAPAAAAGLRVGSR